MLDNTLLQRVSQIFVPTASGKLTFPPFLFPHDKHNRIPSLSLRSYFRGKVARKITGGATLGDISSNLIWNDATKS